MVASAVVANAGEPPELVDGKGHENNVGVVKFVIVANPSPDEAPSGLNGRIGTKTSYFLWFAT